ncbi:hypothetical protein MASR1M45_22870 [Candidatus Kapaibacterium sp.]
MKIIYILIIFLYALQSFSQSAEEYYFRGLKFASKAEYQNAINSFTRVLEMNPKHFKAFLDRGISYHK